MPIEDRNLEPGTALTARYKKQDGTCEVVRSSASPTPPMYWRCVFATSPAGAHREVRT